MTVGDEFNVNRWLAAEGWVLPTFYASMSNEEIELLRTLAGKAKARKAGVWRSLGNMVREQDFDATLVYRGKGAIPDPKADRGKVILPKLFRRLSTWVVNKKAKMVTGSFVAYLDKAPDYLHKTDEFLAQGPSAAPVYKLSSFIGTNGSFKTMPSDMVFREAPSRLVGKDGKPITSW